MASAAAKEAIFVKSEVYEGTRIQGPDFNLPLELDALLESYKTIGFQANGLARAIEIINQMVRLAFVEVRCIRHSCLIVEELETVTRAD